MTDLTALTRNEVPGVKQTSGVHDCTAGDVKLELSAQSQTVPVGGSLDFTMTIAYEGTSSCLIDVSNASRILTITSGSDTIWRSDACPADPHRLLMSKGDKRVDTLTWNTDSTGFAMRRRRQPPQSQSRDVYGQTEPEERCQSSERCGAGYRAVEAIVQ
jgi:hypothetical protein